MNGYTSIKTTGDVEDFEFMGDTPKEDPAIAEVKQIFRSIKFIKFKLF